MKIADITHDSDINQFLNLAQLEEFLNVINVEEISKLKEKSIVPISTEIESGGLDEYSLNIGGNPIYHEKAILMIRSLEASFEDLNRICLALFSAGKKHRLEELSTYISKLNQKISSLNQDISSYSQKINFANRSNEKSNIEKYRTAKNGLVNEREKYVNKLEIAKTLQSQTISYSTSLQQQNLNVSNQMDTKVESVQSKTGLIEPTDGLLKQFEL